MLILLHTSKTMRRLDPGNYQTTRPELIDEAGELVTYIQKMSVAQIAKSMQVSSKLAATVADQYQAWLAKSTDQKPAIDSFIGDIYSGLQVQTWSHEDREYAQQVLRIISGLYGVLRPLDAVAPYRLEMGYRLPDDRYKSLYNFWGDKIASRLPSSQVVVDLTAVEYGKTVTPFLADKQVIRPKFLTMSPKTGLPTFVVVHAKIARGAFAAWLIKNRIHNSKAIQQFNELNYQYNPALSTPNEPAYVCKEFGGIGLSVRLT